MSSRASAPAVRIDLLPSPILARALIAAHVLAAVAAVITPVPWWARALMVFALAAHAAWSLRRHAWLRDPGAVRTLTWDSAGDWCWSEVSGRTRRGRLMRAPFVHPALTILRLRDGWYRRAVILTPDRVDAEAFRQLRVRLWWG